MGKDDDARSYHHGNLRAELLDAAIQQLEKVSAQQLSLRAVARSVGVSQTAPYRHFQDKDALLRAMAARGYEQLLSELRAALARSGDRAADQLQALAQAYVDYAVRQESLFKLMFGPLVQPDDDDHELRDVSRETLRLLQGILRHGIDTGEFRPMDAVYLANSAWAGIHGLATLRIDAPSLFRKYVDLSRQREISVNTFIDGISPR